MIIRTTDIQHINHLCNHPDILPYLGYPDDNLLDFSNFLDFGDQYIFLTSEDRLAITRWDQEAPGVYQVHLAFHPDHRGKHALQTFQEMTDWMMNNSEVVMLYGQIEYTNVRARYFARQTSFKSRGFKYLNGSKYEVFICPMNKTSWITQNLLNSTSNIGFQEVTNGVL